MPIATSNLVRTILAVASLAFAHPAVAQEYAPPPPTSAVCPAIDEDGMLCSADLMSGNCVDFVAVAERLGALYRSELQKLPGSEQSLKTTIWWGCGPGNLTNIKALLVQIGTPAALAVLQTEPYRSLPNPPPAPTVPSAAPPSCADLATALERNLCIGAQLHAARAGHARAYARCRDLVIPDLRDDLVAAEKSFETLLPARCDAQASDANEQNLQIFNRSRCLATALADSTRGMLEAHPECAAAP